MKMTNEQIKAKYPETAERLIGERRVIRKLVNSAISQGHTVSVHNGEDWEIKRSVKVQDVMDCIMATDSDRIYIRSATTGDNLCQFYMVYGNSPAEVIADHTDNALAELLYNLSTAGEE